MLKLKETVPKGRLLSLHRPFDIPFFNFRQAIVGRVYKTKKLYSMAEQSIIGANDKDTVDFKQNIQFMIDGIILITILGSRADRDMIESSTLSNVQ